MKNHENINPDRPKLIYPKLFQTLPRHPSTDHLLPFRNVPSPFSSKPLSLSESPLRSLPNQNLPQISRKLSPLVRTNTIQVCGGGGEIPLPSSSPKIALTNFCPDSSLSFPFSTRLTTKGTDRQDLLLTFSLPKRALISWKRGYRHHSIAIRIPSFWQGKHQICCPGSPLSFITGLVVPR